jgi:glutathione S-transferase
MGPNPWKTVIVFEELGIPYSTTYLDFGDANGGVENEEFLKKNPAGRVPLINDPNTGKSGSIARLASISNTRSIQGCH